MTWLDLLNNMPGFFLVFIRMLAFFTMSPVFSLTGVPVQVKIGLSMVVSMVIYPSLLPMAAPIGWTYFFQLIEQALIGLCLGFAAALIWAAVQMSAALIDMQMGFVIAGLFDPQTGTQMPLMGRLHYVLATLLLLAYDGHHLLLKGILESFRWISPVQAGLTWKGFDGWLTDGIAQMFFLALQISAPIVGALFLADVILGVIARTVPQMNIFVVGLPIKMLLGFFCLLLVLPGYLYLFSEVFKRLIAYMGQLVQLWGGA
jgi:flagellar biosynthetic protein FliR